MRFYESLRVSLTILLGFICYLGDRLVENHSSGIEKAIFDSSTHAIVGLLSSIIIVLQIRQNVDVSEKCLLIFTCFLLSSLIDIDHFIEAKSLKLSVSIMIYDEIITKYF